MGPGFHCRGCACPPLCLRWLHPDNAVWKLVFRKGLYRHDPRIVLHAWPRRISVVWLVSLDQRHRAVNLQAYVQWIESSLAPSSFDRSFMSFLQRMGIQRMLNVSRYSLRVHGGSSCPTLWPISTPLVYLRRYRQFLFELRTRPKQVLLMGPVMIEQHFCLKSF